MDSGFRPGDFVVDDRERGVFKVNRRLFTDPSIFELERERIFKYCWLYACHESEFQNDGDFVTRRVGGRPLILVRGQDGVIRGLLNACRHRANIVCREESGNANGFRCFYHAWVYSNTGELLALPGSESYSDAFNPKEMGLRNVPRMESYRGFYFVNYDADAVPLDQYLAGTKEYIDLLTDYCEKGLLVIPGTSYTVRANWKLYYENGGDAYHLMSAHRRYMFDFMGDLGAPITRPLDRGEPMPTLSLGNGHSVIMLRFDTNPFSLAARDELEAKRVRLKARYGVERANRIMDGVGLVNFFPNSIFVDQLRTFRTAFPISADLVEVNQWGMMPREDNDEVRRKRLSNYASFLGPAGFATPDDNEALESCQRGFAADPDEWTYLSRGMKREQSRTTDELHVRAFWRRWCEMIGDDRERVRYEQSDCGDHA